MKWLTVVPKCGNRKCKREGTHFYILYAGNRALIMDWFCAKHYLEMIREHLHWGKFLTGVCGIQYSNPTK